MDFTKNGLTAPFQTASAVSGRASLWKSSWFTSPCGQWGQGSGRVPPFLVHSDATWPCHTWTAATSRVAPAPVDAAPAVGEGKGRWSHAWPTWSPSVLRWLHQGLRGEQWWCQPQWAAQQGLGEQAGLEQSLAGGLGSECRLSVAQVLCWGWCWVQGPLSTFADGEMWLVLQRGVLHPEGSYQAAGRVWQEHPEGSARGTAMSCILKGSFPSPGYVEATHPWGSVGERIQEFTVSQQMCKQLFQPCVPMVS